MTHDNRSSDLDIEAKRATLAAALDHAPFEGWTQPMLTRAVQEAGQDGLFAARAFPRGPVDLVAFWIAEADHEMETALAALNLPAMKIRARIAAALRWRFAYFAPHREAVRRALSLLALPQNAGVNLGTLYGTVDSVWRAVGDVSTDWNFYTKRMLLAGVYGSTMLVWLNDRTPDLSETFAFLDRRIQDVMQIQKARAQIEGAFGRCAERFPSALRRA